MQFCLIGLIFISTLILSACGPSQQETEYNGRMCGYALIYVQKPQITPNTPQETKEARKKFKENCSGLTEAEMKIVFQRFLSREIGQSSLEVIDDKFVDETRATPQKRYTGKVETIHGDKRFNMYMTPQDGIILEIAKPYN